MQVFKHTARDAKSKVAIDIGCRRAKQAHLSMNAATGGACLAAAGGLR
jgi:hypothetical protein